MNRGPEFGSPPTLDELFGKPVREWLQIGGYSNQERKETDRLRTNHEVAVGGAMLSEKSRGVLFLLSKEGSATPQRLEELAEGYEDWRAIFQVVNAGWANASETGTAITQQGKDVAGKLFELQDRTE